MKDWDPYHKPRPFNDVPGCRRPLLISCCELWPQTRIQMRVPEYGWTTQKVFHLLNFLVAGLRAAVFASWDKVRHQAIVE